MQVSVRRWASGCPSASNLRQRVTGYAGDVFHHLDGILEDVVVDPLVDVADADAGLVIPSAVSVVDVPGAECLRLDKVGAHLEQRRNRAEVMHEPLPGKDPPDIRRFR